LRSPPFAAGTREELLARQQLYLSALNLSHPTLEFLGPRARPFLAGSFELVTQLRALPALISETMSRTARTRGEAMA
jgi:hypothetical protein